MKPDYIRAVNKAKQLLNSNPSFKERRPVNFKAILDALELTPEICHMDDEALLKPKERKIQIRYDNLPPSRKFFSIAHEIGHWMLHSHDKPRPRYENYTQLDPQRIAEEQEANAFAAELLMPYDEVIRCIFYGYSIQNLAEYFNVSYEFAFHRYNFVAAGII